MCLKKLGIGSGLYGKSVQYLLDMPICITRHESSGKTFSQLWIFWGSYINWNLCNATSQGPLKPFKLAKEKVMWYFTFMAMVAKEIEFHHYVWAIKKDSKAKNLAMISDFLLLFRYKVSKMRWCLVSFQWVEIFADKVLFFVFISNKKERIKVFFFFYQVS